MKLKIEIDLEAVPHTDVSAILKEMGELWHDWGSSGEQGPVHAANGDVVGSWTQMLDTVQLEAGGVYRARNGTLHGPLRANPNLNSEYAFASLQAVTWTAEGCYLGPNRPDRLDLIAIMQRGTP